MVKATADLHSPQLAIKPHRPRGVGGNFAGVFLPTFAAAIYKTSGSMNACEEKAKMSLKLQTAEENFSAQS